jgi:membrane-bound serine protease (ClpP class)
VTLAILLFFAGLAFIVAEILFTSFGLLAVLATVCLGGAMVFAFRESTAAGFWVVGASVVLVPATILAGFKVLPKTPIGRALILDAGAVEHAKGFASSPAATRPIVGKEGIALSALRPAGVVEVDGSRVDVVTEGEMIAKGARVRVIHTEGTRIVVEESKA